MVTRASYLAPWRGRSPATDGPLALARIGEDGRGWYQEAHNEVTRYAGLLGTDPQRVADVLAITSPRVTVSRNTQIAAAYLEGRSIPFGILPMIWKGLDHYEATGEIRGPKTSQFARAIMGDPDATVVDVWVIRGLGRADERLTPKRYREAASVLRGLATRIGWPVAEFQAALWRGTRLAHGITHGGPLLLPTEIQPSEEHVAHVPDAYWDPVF